LSENIFSQRLRELRLSKGLTLTQLAKNLSLHKTSVFRFEDGSVKPAFDTLLALAVELDCTVDYLMGREGAKGPGAPRWVVEMLPDMARLDSKGREAVKGLVKALKR
jgi:transcriptional regulator with XRE-family HTH domain